MSMTETIPVTIEPDAAARVEELGMQDELQRMLDECKRALPGLWAIKVEVALDPSGGNDPGITINPQRQVPGQEDDPADRLWGQWFIRTFPPEVCWRFGMMSSYGDPDGR